MLQEWDTVNVNIVEGDVIKSIDGGENSNMAMEKRKMNV
jgi:hypothetical protein